MLACSGGAFERLGGGQVIHDSVVTGRVSNE